ncbi:uncharacterized protein LOC142344169 [Convolutriloba macropyga]|uniref:uncharacterized protein LOC142344169 n=1 Tax=Convolutriloba macropyga TaxID=536237 RepID=UPI003F51B65B
MRSGKGPGFSGEGKIDRGNEETKTTDGKTTSKSWNQREGKFESVKSEHNGELKFDQLFNDAIKYRDHLRSENQKSLDEKSASDNDARQQGNGNTESEKGAGSSDQIQNEDKLDQDKQAVIDLMEMIVNESGESTPTAADLEEFYKQDKENLEGDLADDNSTSESEEEKELCDFCKKSGTPRCIKCLLGKSSKKIKKMGAAENIYGFSA